MWRLLGGLPVDSDDDSPDSSSPDSDDSEEEEDSSNSSAVASRPIPVVDLASPSTAVRRPLAATAADDDDDDVQILTAEEAAATVAAAAERGDAASRKRKRKRVETKAEPTECTICCEDCTIVGRHRLVALRCGHLFGKKCIEHWLSEKRTCPNCNSAVKRTDICPLFSDHVAVVDNSGVEEMKRKFDEEKKRSAKLEKEVAEVMKQLQLKAEQAMKLQVELIRWKKTAIDLRYKLERGQSASTYQPTTGGSSSSASDFPVDAPPAGALPLAAAAARSSSGRAASNRATTSPARQSTIPPWLSQLQAVPTMVFHSPETQRRPEAPVAVISTSQPSQEPSSGNLDASIRNYKLKIDFPLQNARVFSIARSCSFLCVGEKLGLDSYGPLKFSTWEPRCTTGVGAHSSTIRDICINANEDLAVSVAFDGKLAVTNFQMVEVVIQIPFPPGRQQGWSCALSRDDPFAIYCGFQDGTVAQYDMRKPAAGEQGIVKIFSLPERQPVHAIKLFRSHEGPEGLAAATFRGLSVWKNVADVATDDTRRPSSGTTAPPPHPQVSSIPPCFSLSSSQLHTNKVVVSSRSQGPTPTMHSVYNLHTLGSTQLAPTAELIGHKAPSVLSRSAIWSEADGASVVASWSQDTEKVTIWDVASNREVHGPEYAHSEASASMPVVDIQHAVEGGNWSSGTALFGTLTARQLCVYKSMV